MLLSSIFYGCMLGYAILICGAMVVKVKVDKEMLKRRIESATEEVKEINDSMIADRQEHKKKMEKIYADAEKFLDKQYGKPLEDEEVVTLHELFERAKRDNRFKEGLKNIRLSDVYYEAMFAKCRKFKGE